MQPAAKIAFETNRYGPELLIDARPAEAGTRSWYQRPHRFDFYEVLLVTRGRGWVRQDQLASRVEPGTAVLTAPGCVRTLDLDADSSRFILCFQPEFLSHVPAGVWPGMLPSRSGRPSASSTVKLEAQDLTNLLDTLSSMELEIGRLDDESRDLLWMKLHEVLLEIKRASRKQLVLGSNADPWTTRFLTLVERRFRESHRVSDYASWMAVTPGHLGRLARRHLGIGPKAVLRERLLLEARRLLADGSRTVSEIALDLGFEDSSYFSRFFRRWQGVSPGEFRRRADAPSDAR